MHAAANVFSCGGLVVVEEVFVRKEGEEGKGSKESSRGRERNGRRMGTEAYHTTRRTGVKRQRGERGRKVLLTHRCRAASPV